MINATVATSAVTEKLALVRERHDVYRGTATQNRAAMVRLGEALHELRQLVVDRIAYGQLVSPHVNMKTAQRAVNKYLESVGAAKPAPNKTDGKTEQNPPSGRQSVAEIGTGAVACQTAAQPLSQDDLEDLLGCTPVSTFVTCDEPEAGEGEGGFEDEFEDERLGEESEEFEISNLKFESGEVEAAGLESRAPENPLRLAPTDSAPPSPPPWTKGMLKAGEREILRHHAPMTGPQLTLASLYEQAQTVGTEFMRVIESGLDEAVKARLVADVRALVQTAQFIAGGV